MLSAELYLVVQLIQVRICFSFLQKKKIRPPADRTTAVTPLDLVSLRLAFQWYSWSSMPAKTRFLSRSNVAVKLIPRFTTPTSLHGEASLRKRGYGAFSLDGLQPSSATLFREPANMGFMKFLSTSTEIRCSQI